MTITEVIISGPMGLQGPPGLDGKHGRDGVESDELDELRACVHELESFVLESKSFSLFALHFDPTKLLNTHLLPQEPVSLDEAYKMQFGAMERYRLNRGESFAGMKAGLTALATQQNYGISSALYGQLADSMLLTSPATIPASGWISGAKRYEAEAGFRMNSVDMSLAPFTTETIVPYIKNFAPVMEIIDFRSFGGSSVPSVFVCANVFVKDVVLGTEVPYDASVQTAIDAINVTMYEGGVANGVTGTTSNVEPSVLQVLVDVVNHCAEYNRSLDQDAFIITGSFIGVNALPDDVTVKADFGSFGEVEVLVTSS